MSEVDAVLTAFLSLAGLDEGEKERWRGLCASAWDGLLRAAGAIRDDAILSLADLADFSPKVLFEVKP